MQDTYNFSSTDICVTVLLNFAVKRYLSLLTWRLYMSKYTPDNTSWTDWVWQADRLCFSRKPQFIGCFLETNLQEALTNMWQIFYCFRAVKPSHADVFILQDSQTLRLPDFKTSTLPDSKTPRIQHFITYRLPDPQTFLLYLFLDPQSRCHQRSQEGNLRR